MQIPETEIIVTEDGAEILRKTVGPGDYVIGREPACDLHLDVELVSPRHAQLIVNFDHTLIEDLGSESGTIVNGEPIKECTRLWPNQKIQIGSATVEVHRIKSVSPPDVSLAPQTAAMRRLLPEEFLREKKYDIGKVVAQGGMGAILNATEATTDRRVAMKVMLDGSSPDDLTRFVAEAKVTAQLEHPSIVPVYELSIDENGQPFYTMKMVRGITLRKVLELLAEGVPETVKKYPLPALLTIFQKVCDALAFAHSKGVIHRDLKPENIMLDDFGVVLVMDWGLAKVLGKKDATAVDITRSVVRTLPPEAASATIAGTVMGTPQYMSPEQARGEVENLDARSDIYALGAILYHTLALRPPVMGSTASEVVEKVANGQVEPLTAPKNRLIPDSIAAVVRKAMSFDREQRYPHVAGLQRDIDAYQNGRATSAENAGLGKQIVLLVKRHKALFSSAFAAWFIITALAVWFVINITRAKQQAESARKQAEVERGRATAEAKRAELALSDLKRSAPALLQLAESEAGAQRFASALEKMDAAVAVDPALLRAWWQRAWVLLGMERWSDAVDALRLAQQHDPASAKKLASILPAVEKIGAVPEAERWKSETAREVFHHLESVEATGPALAFSRKFQLGAEERRKLTDQRLLASLGKGNYGLEIGRDGLVSVYIGGKPIASLEPLRGLSINKLDANRTPIANLEPLRGMVLQDLNLFGCPDVVNLAPLRGMPLRTLLISLTQVCDLSPLVGMPLLHFEAGGITNLNDFSPLTNAPLENLRLEGTKASDLSFLQGMPLHRLYLSNTSVVNLAALRGLPLELLHLDRTLITDLTPLEDAPLKELNLRGCFKLTDFSPILTLPLLERLTCDALPKELVPLRKSKTLQTIDAETYPGEGIKGPRPVAEFWKAFDHAATTRQEELAPAIAALQKMGLGNLAAQRLGVNKDGLLEMDLSGLPISDLSPLTGLPVASLNLDNTKVADLGPLHGMPLVNIDVSRTLVKDLSPLQGMSLNVLMMHGCPVSDLKPLQGMPLIRLGLGLKDATKPREGFTNVSDLSVLRGMPLEWLALNGTNDPDLTPLAECRNLLRVVLPLKARNVEALRGLPNLHRISWGFPGSEEKIPDEATFWKDYDARQAAGKK